MARLKVSGAATPWIAGAGALALGIVIGLFLARYFVGLQTFTLEDFGILIGLIAGGVLVNYIASMQGGPEALGLYGVGLLVGFGLYFVGVGDWFPDPNAADAALFFLRV